MVPNRATHHILHLSNKNVRMTVLIVIFTEIGKWKFAQVSLPHLQNLLQNENDFFVVDYGYRRTYSRFFCFKYLDAVYL